MLITVHETVRRPSVCLFVPSFTCRYGGFAAERRARRRHGSTAARRPAANARSVKFRPVIEDRTDPI